LWAGVVLCLKKLANKSRYLFAIAISSCLQYGPAKGGVQQKNTSFYPHFVDNRPPPSVPNIPALMRVDPHMRVFGSKYPHNTRISNKNPHKLQKSVDY
jgi:hypothetical protein